MQYVFSVFFVRFSVVVIAPEYVHSTQKVLTPNLCDYHRFSNHVDTFRRD